MYGTDKPASDTKALRGYCYNMRTMNTEEKKLITYTIPCYNSAEYMDKCVESILACGKDDIEIIIVDDGSTKDNTFEKAQAWELKRPGIIRAIHQENGGHGAAVMCGLAHARGMYFKVVDSDDWLDNEANVCMLHTLHSFDDPLDLLVVNYVYEHTADNTREVMNYHRMLPPDRVFTWDELGYISVSKYILMHSVVYRTQMLRESGLDLPRHTFYVDNIFVYVPLPRCERIYYLDVDLYRYFIGREDQSVNESVMIGRIDQQLRITRVMIDAYHLEEDVESQKLRSYMRNYLSMMMTICTVFSMMSDREDKEELRSGIWNHLSEHDPETYAKIRRSAMGAGMHLPGKAGDKMLLKGYHLAQKIFKFN
jgi:glycosyltransferase involved in cell wall biosynthesis